MLNNIQILRAFAAINVVFYHIIGISVQYEIPATVFLFMKNWGQNGVDIFFVISGFIMVYIQTKKSKSPLEFLKNRVERIVPIYWFFTTLLCILFFLIPFAFKNTELTVNKILLSFLFVENLIKNDFPVLYVGWTLEYEMFFYVVFALCLFINEPLRRYLVMIGILSFFVFFTHLDYIIYEFVLGMLCAFIFFNVKKRFEIFIFVFGIVGLFLSIFFESNIDRLILWGIPAFLIVLGVIWMKQLKNKFFQYLGDASYSIYLIQVFTIPVFYKFSIKYLYFINANIIAIMCLVFSVFCGCVFYKLIESKIASFFKKLNKKEYI